MAVGTYSQVYPIKTHFSYCFSHFMIVQELQVLRENMNPEEILLNGSEIHEIIVEEQRREAGQSECILCRVCRLLAIVVGCHCTVLKLAMCRSKYVATVDMPGD